MVSKFLLDKYLLEAVFFGAMGCAAAMAFSGFGAAYGTAKASVGISSLAVIDQSKLMQSIIPVVMAGILGIYGIIVCITISGKFKTAGDYALADGYKHFGAGLIIGLSCLASGLAIGVAGDATVRAYAQTGSMFVIMIMIMIFAECIALYGLIIAIIITS